MYIVGYLGIEDKKRDCEYVANRSSLDEKIACNNVLPNLFSCSAQSN